jgi:hypothetical protein
MYKIAFHLGRGKNFMHWQVKDDAGNVFYVDPKINDIILHNCTLRNQKAASLRIFNGGEKNRCAWVQFESYEVTPLTGIETDTQLRFNPRVSPTWMVAETTGQDGREFVTIYTNQSKLFIK